MERMTVNERTRATIPQTIPAMPVPGLPCGGTGLTGWGGGSVTGYFT